MTEEPNGKGGREGVKQPPCQPHWFEARCSDCHTKIPDTKKPTNPHGEPVAPCANCHQMVREPSRWFHTETTTPCSSCHVGGSWWKAPQDEIHSGSTHECGKCHTQIPTRWRKGFEGRNPHPALDPRRSACTDCHVSRPATTGCPRASSGEIRCQNCHLSTDSKARRF